MYSVVQQQSYQPTTSRGALKNWISPSFFARPTTSTNNIVSRSLKRAHPRIESREFLIENWCLVSNFISRLCRFSAAFFFCRWNFNVPPIVAGGADVELTSALESDLDTTTSIPASSFVVVRCTFSLTEPETQHWIIVQKIRDFFYHLQRISCRIVLFCVTEKVFLSSVVHRTHLATCDSSCKFYNNFNSPYTEPHKCFSFISLPSFLCVSFYSSFFIIYLLNVYKVAIIVTDPTLDVVAQQLRMCEHDTLTRQTERERNVTKKNTNFNDPIIVVSWHLARFKKISIRRSLHCPSSKSPTTYLVCRVVDDEKYMSTFFESDEREREKGTTAVSRKHQRLFCLYNHHSVGLRLASAQLKIILKVSRVSFSATWSLILFCEFHYISNDDDDNASFLY